MDELRQRAHDSMKELLNLSEILDRIVAEKINLIHSKDEKGMQSMSGDYEKGREV